MAAPYLIEIRTGGRVKERLREITYDVADRFDVRGAVDPRPVPHITLFGPYNTDAGLDAKRIVQDTLSDYDIVPYRIDGFGRFAETKVIYANVIPSPELRALRRELSRSLRPISYNYPPYDEQYFYDFHITIAFKDVTNEFEDIWTYVNDVYEIQFDTYATRVTGLRRRDMMWEYDLLQDRELRPDEATSAESWQRTSQLLNTRQSPHDHDDLAPKPEALSRFLHSAKAKLLRGW